MALDGWPFLRQLRTSTDGTGEESFSRRTRDLHARIAGAEVARSICPYCGVGCGQLVFQKDGEILTIEADPESPVSGGTLCPKGAASHELLSHPARLTKVMYRRPGGRSWEPLELERAMDMIADRVWETRKRTFEVRDEAGKEVRHTVGIAHLGGATLDNEENYLNKKQFTGAHGMGCVSNQARI